VPPRVRRELARRDILSYRVFYFERDGENNFKKPEEYPLSAVAAATTHDLPTLTGYWLGEDIRLKTAADLYPQPQMAADDTAARARDRERLLAAVGLGGKDFRGGGQRSEPPAPSPAPPPSTPYIDLGEIGGSEDSCPEEIRFRVLEYLAQSQAALMEVRLEEIFGVPFQQNLPGTITQYPNWRRKIPLTLKEMRNNPAALGLAARLRKYRGKKGQGVESDQ
jgi:4-alpha-glucanotransferase